MRHTRLTAALIGIGAAVTLLIPATGASADPGRGRPAKPRIRQEVRHGHRLGHHRKPHKPQVRRNARRDAYRKGYEAGRRDARRFAHRRDGRRVFRGLAAELARKRPASSG